MQHVTVQPDNEECRLLGCYAVWFLFLQEQHDLTSHKTAFFIVTVLKILNFTQNLWAEPCSGDVMCLLWGKNWDFISQKMAFVISHRRGNIKSYIALTDWSL
jgi:hypothetical protein